MKNQKTITYISLIFIIISCNSKNQKSSDNRNDKYYTYFYSNGNIKTKAELRKNDTIFEGSYQEFNTDGELVFNGNMSNNKLNGPYITYYDNGNIRSKGFFKNGLKNGKSVWYYDNNLDNLNKINTIAYYKKDSLFSHQYFYNENGSLKRYKFYDHKGRMIYYESYNNKNIIDFEGNKTPNIIINQSLAEQRLNKGDSLKLKMYFVMPPKSKYNISTKIKGLEKDWKDFKGAKENEFYIYKRLIDTIGEFEFKIRSKNLNDSKIHKNGFKFQVLD